MVRFEFTLLSVCVNGFHTACKLQYESNEQTERRTNLDVQSNLCANLLKYKQFKVQK